MPKRLLLILSILLAFGLVAAACGDDDDTATDDTSAEEPTDDGAAEEPTDDGAAEEPADDTASEEPADDGAAEEPTDDAAPAEPIDNPVKACVATGQAGVDDQSFNASAWEGVQAAVEAGAATEDSFFLEPGEASQYQAVVTQLIEQGCEHIVTIGFDLGEVTATNAAEQPDITWTMVDNILSDPETFEPLQLPNVRELVYQTDEAAFAAGYLAAGMSQTGVLCTYGGGNFPTVSIFMDGFARGAQHYNEVKGTDVSVLGWDPEAQDGIFTGSFTDMGLARSTADGLFQEDCDMILPVGGAINLPAGDAINDLGIEAGLIGVDSDAFFAMPSQYQSLWLTTIEKKIAEFVTEAIAEDALDTWAPGSFVGTVANGGVGLSPYHDWDDRVPDELRAEVDQLLVDIADGTIDASFTPVGY